MNGGRRNMAGAIRSANGIQVSASWAAGVGKGVLVLTQQRMIHNHYIEQAF